ncbi:MAG: hypothetical protein O3B76_06505 [Proteobacteria bacterium]|nr:hypothetical protein [Pseudomonadota bacterium]
MNTISDSALPWSAPVYASRSANIEVAVATQGAPDRAVGNKDGGEQGGGEQGEDGFKMFGDDGFTFFDFLDIINPLQHIPVIGTLYRQITDDTLDPGSRVIGGTLFLGPVGTVASVANVLVDDATGKDVGEHFLAFFEGDKLELADSDIPSGAQNSASATVTDVGARSFSPPPEYIPGQPTSPTQVAAPARKSLSGAEMAKLDTSGPLDPVTAWAMSETIYQNSAVGNPAARSEVNIIEGSHNTEPGNWQAVPSRERAALAPARPQNTAPAATTLEAANAIKDARASNAYYAATSYGRAKPAPDRASRDNTASNPTGSPGAIATEGGWFTDTMLTALGRYNDSASLAAREKPAVVDLNR